MPKPTKRSLGRIVLVVLGVVIIGLLIYHFWLLMTPKTSRIDILKVEKLIVDEGTFDTLKGEKIETEKLSAGKVEIQEAKIQEAKIQEAKIQEAKIQKAEIEECLEECATPKSTCENECSYVGQRRCAPGCIGQNQYQICGNYDADSCLEWSQRYTCPAGKICRTGYCVPRCLSHHRKACYNNDVYWYNSCNRREEKYQECGSDSYGGWGAKYCSGNSVYQKMTYHYRGCSEGRCYDNSYERERLVEVCSANEVCQSGECQPLNGCPPGGPGPDPP